MQPAGQRRLAQLPNHIAMRPHFNTVVVGQGTLVQLEAVMVLGHWHVVLRPRGLNQIQPLVRIEFLGGE